MVVCVGRWLWLSVVVHCSLVLVCCGCLVWSLFVFRCRFLACSFIVVVAKLYELLRIVSLLCVVMCCLLCCCCLRFDGPC